MLRRRVSTLSFVSSRLMIRERSSLYLGARQRPALLSGPLLQSCDADALTLFCAHAFSQVDKGRVART